jgi:cytochrome P450
MTPDRPVIDFDHHAPDFDPKKTYGTLRQNCPVAWSESHGGFWVLTRYRDVANVARKDAIFSSARDAEGHGGIVIPEWTTETSIPIELDPPEQMLYRTMLNQLFSPTAVEAMKPMIATFTTQTIDEFIERGECDLINDLTGPGPALVTVTLLGLPTDYANRFARAVHDVFGSAPGSEREARGREGIAWSAEKVLEAIKLRRDEPGDDMISYLCHQNIDGQPLSDEVVLSIVKLVVAGGMDTTTSLTGQTLVYLSEHHDLRDRLIANPDLLVPGTDEFLRVFAPSQSMGRTVRQPTEVGGCPMTPGERVLIPWVAGNFDGERFENPEQIILDRPRNHHLSFGLGFHRCVGAHLAKAMFQEMMRQVLSRLPDYRVLADRLVPYASHGNQTGWDSVPAVFTPGPRLATTAA